MPTSISVLSALRASGRRIVTVTTCPSRSTVQCAVLIGSSSAMPVSFAARQTRTDSSVQHAHRTGLAHQNENVIYCDSRHLHAWEGFDGFAGLLAAGRERSR